MQSDSKGDVGGGPTDKNDVLCSRALQRLGCQCIADFSRMACARAISTLHFHSVKRSPLMAHDLSNACLPSNPFKSGWVLFLPASEIRLVVLLVACSDWGAPVRASQQHYGTEFFKYLAVLTCLLMDAHFSYFTRTTSTPLLCSLWQSSHASSCAHL